MLLSFDDIIPTHTMHTLCKKAQNALTLPLLHALDARTTTALKRARYGMNVSLSITKNATKNTAHTTRTATASTRALGLRNKRHMAHTAAPYTRATATSQSAPARQKHIRYTRRHKRDLRPPQRLINDMKYRRAAHTQNTLCNI